MSYLITQLMREWGFLLRQKYVVVLLLCSLVLSGFAIYSGLSEVSAQQQTIERLKAADQSDRSKVQQKQNDAGMLAYYSFHLTYSQPSNLGFAALGERDIFPWKHRINLLALEGQIYESDAQNAELAQAGKIDFVFVISALAPLVIILLFHDLFANERTSGRHDLLVTTAKSYFALWGVRITVRFVAVIVCLMLPFFVGAVIAGASGFEVAYVSLLCIAYLGFWTALSVWWGKNATSAPRVASSLIGLWVLFAFIIPILGDLAINKSVHSPKGGDIMLTQREAVNDAWDLPKSATMQPFVKEFPEFAPYIDMSSEFEWKWYYAFQQMGDLKAAELSKAYRDAAAKKYELAGFVSWVSPPLLLQRILTREANTDSIAAYKYEQQIRDYHQQLREFYYPWLFYQGEPTKEALKNMPRFDTIPKS
jgi:ABC-2 type transport system permease protein